MSACIHPRHGATPPLPADGLMLCERCLARLRTDLAAIVSLWGLLAEMVTPGNGGSSGAAAGKPGSRPPCSLDILDITDPRGAVCQQIGGWARMVIEERQLAAAPADAEQAARLLTIHADWVAAQPWADEACAEIHDAAYAIRRACKDLPDRPVGTCPDIDPRGESDRCGGPLRWIDGSTAVRCARCGSSWRADDLVNVGRVSPLNLWESVPNVAVMLDMSERTLRHWVLTGKVKRNSLGQVSHADAWRHAHRDLPPDDAAL